MNIDGGRIDIGVFDKLTCIVGGRNLFYPHLASRGYSDHHTFYKCCIFSSEGFHKRIEHGIGHEAKNEILDPGILRER
jgi:hypothetical protein